MDDRNGLICSQSFFVSQKTKNNKLSLKSKHNRQLEDSVANTASGKQIVPSDNLENQPADVNFLRSDALKSSSIGMEKYLERFKNTGPTRREPLSRKAKQSVLVLDKKNSIYIRKPHDKTENPSENYSFDCKESPVPASHIVSIKTVFGKESETVSSSSGMGVANDHGGVNVKDSIVRVSSSSKENESHCVEKPVDSDTSPSKTDGTNILLCPLCWKPFECKDAQFTHMKTCAAKHKVSTKQLLDLLELIQRQEDERKALGVPLLPRMIPKKVKKDTLVSSMRPKNALDGNLQLGLALSESLKESELQKERDHLLEAGLFTEADEKGLLPIQQIEESHPLPTAPIFLNVGKKCTDSGIVLRKTRKKNPKYGQGGRVPTLLKRTPEEREKLITEKVAIILIGDENVNPTICNFSGDKENNPEWKIQSEKLRKYLCEENIWWKMASLSPSSSSKDQFYVASLSNFISPCKVVAGSKLKHLSQIPGRKSTPLKSSTAQLHNSADRGKMEISPPVSTSCGSKVDIDIFSKKKAVKRNLFDESLKHVEQNTLSRDWNMLVGNHEMSDITIYTQEDRKIPAHKLVFYARCPAILEELVEEKTIGGHSSCMLLWVETCYSAALEFLKYIYAGAFSEAAATNKNVLEHLNTLAERYEVKDLLALLDKVPSSSELHENCTDPSLSKVDKSGCPYNENPSPLPVNLEGSESCRMEMETSLNVKVNDFEIDRKDEVNSASLSPIVGDVGRSSPDIFLATTTIGSPSSVEILEDKPENAEVSGRSDGSLEDGRESIDYLVSLMEKDNSFCKSTENDLQASEHDDPVNNEEAALNQTGVNMHISESPSFFDGKTSCDNFIEPNTPKTPSWSNEAEELLVYSTPALKETTLFKKSNNLVGKEALRVSNDVKRKLTSSDNSNPTTPIPKKICIEENVDTEDAESNKKEVIDLTHSGSEVEEVAENALLNESGVSTIPAPDWDSCALTPSKGEAAPCSLVSSPRETYISNVWDDFDYIPDVHHADLGEPIYDSQKSFLAKGNEDVAHAVTSSDNHEESDLKKIAEPSDKSPVTTSPKIHHSPERSIFNDGEELEKMISSPTISAQASPEKEVDITEKLLEASLRRIDNSIYWRDENDPGELAAESNSSLPCQTPVRTRLKMSGSKTETPETPAYSRQKNVTPLADYSSMKTPTLHKELDRYGIKHLKRNQAKQLLRHIYNELHPVVSTEAECSNKSSHVGGLNEREVSGNEESHSKESKAANKRKITFESLDLSSDELSSSEESSDSSSDSVIMEESMYEPQLESPIKSQTLSQKDAHVDIPTAMKNLIESDPAFHRKILLYEPIWLSDIKVALKANGAKFNVNQLMDYLDEQCITFRIAQGNRHQKRKKPPKKKNFSLSQPCNQKGKSKEPFSSSQPC